MKNIKTLSFLLNKMKKVKWYLFFFLSFSFLFVHFDVSSQDNHEENLQKQLQQFIDQDDQIGASKIYNKIAFNAWSDNNLQKAIENFSNSLDINQAIGNKNAIAAINSYLGVIYSDLERFDKALTHLNEALALKKEQGEKEAIVNELLNISVVFRHQTQHNKALKVLDEALELAKEANDLKLLRRIYGMLAENYESIGNGEKSLEYFNLFTTIDGKVKEDYIKEKEAESEKKISEAEKRTKIAEALKEEKEQALEKTEKELNTAIKISKERQLQIDLLNKENQIKELTLKEQEARLRNETLVRKATFAGLFLVIVIAGVLYTAYRQKKRSNHLLFRQNQEIIKQKEQIQEQSNELQKAFAEISDKNNKINRSINYAKRIQFAMLAHWDKVDQLLGDSFVFFKPKDIVSGDFYWCREIGDNQLILAAVDCTGHGVPGAFMSMIANKLLHEIIEVKNIISPDEILKSLHKGIRQSLKQESTNNKDGMDIALCKIDLNKKELEYAGARNPLIYIKNDELYEIEGDRKSIGGFPDVAVKTFTKHNLSVDSTTYCYIFSDGYQDQFGGKKGNKFLLKNLKKLLLKNHKLAPKDQYKALDKALAKWRGDFIQIDDILVIGFRLEPDRTAS